MCQPTWFASAEKTPQRIVDKTVIGFCITLPVCYLHVCLSVLTIRKASSLYHIFPTTVFFYYYYGILWVVAIFCHPLIFCQHNGRFSILARRSGQLIKQVYMLNIKLIFYWGTALSSAFCATHRKVYWGEHNIHTICV